MDPLAARMSLSARDGITIRTQESRTPGFVVLEHRSADLGSVEGRVEIQAAWLEPVTLESAEITLIIESVAGATVTLDVHLDLRDTLNRSFRTIETVRIVFERPPQQTQLLPNFPNPFNPDTWIPYDLAVDAQVTIQVYALDGELVRTLDLGEQFAGGYRDRQRAAYWDGRNDDGELASSGAYFAEMAAGEYRQIRRIVLMK